MGKRILLNGLFLSAMVASAFAQSAPLLPSSGPAETRRETQPPQQSGQAQQMMKEARVELERAALQLEAAASEDKPAAILSSREALVQFEQSLEQLHQSLSGYVPSKLAASLLEQVAHTHELLEHDAAAASRSMHELTLRVTDLTAEADLLVGRPLLGADGEKLGDISNVLINADGQTQALVVDRLAPSRNSQFLVEWTDVSIEGPNLVANIVRSQTGDLENYLAD